MAMNNALKSTLVSKSKSFCKHCTLHGVYYFYKASSCSLHLLWAMIIAASVTLCCFLGHMIWQKFVIDPTLTVVETTHYSMFNIPFPAVTICDTESVYLPNTQNITNLLILRGYNMTEINDFYKSFTNVKRKDYTPEPYVRKMHSLLEDLGYPLNYLLEMFKRPCSDVVVECYWRSKSHNCTEMFRSVLTIMGHCCQFDIPYFMQHADNQTNYIPALDSTEALDITVKGQSSNGYSVLYVYDYKDKVTLIDSYFSLRPESLFDINVYVWAIDSSTYVKALPISSRKCILETFKRVQLPVSVCFAMTIRKSQGQTLRAAGVDLRTSCFSHGQLYVACSRVTSPDSLYILAPGSITTNDQGVGAGFYQGCMTRLILRRVVNHCRCLPFDYTSQELDVEEFSICSWDHFICIYQRIEMIEVDIKNIISDSECYQRCDYVQYDTEVEFVKNKRHLSTLNETRSRVLVHFGQNTCMKYRREVLYTWDQMLANLGGIFGLCLGGSVISVIEIICFLLEILFAVLGSWCKSPVIVPEENVKNKVFIVSQKDMFLKKSSGKKVDGKYKFVN